MIYYITKHERPPELCKRCGKTPRADATGYCQDCADTLAMRGLLVPLPGEHAGEAAAEAERESLPDDDAP